jgi:hypothetical protein
MKFSDVERLLDVARSDRQRVVILERVLPKLRGEGLRSALIVLANLYVLRKEFRKASGVFEIVGMHEDAVKARARI